MRRRLLFAPSAAEDLRLAADWYRAQRPGLEFELRAAVDATLARLREFPESGSPLSEEPGVRRSLVARPFQAYSLYTELRGDALAVVAFVHNARSPERLQDALREGDRSLADRLGGQGPSPPPGQSEP